MNQKAAFLDRDGTLIQDVDYLKNPEDIHWLPEVLETLSHLQGQGFALIIITNQSGIGRGFFSEETYKKVTEELIRQAHLAGITFSGIYYCPHAPDDNCKCRKPLTGLFSKAIDEHCINASLSLAIGDRERDLEPAQKLGVTQTYLVKKNCGFTALKEKLSA